MTKTMTRTAPAGDSRLEEALASLRARQTQRDLANLTRCGIAVTNPLGGSMANIQKVDPSARWVGKDAVCELSNAVVARQLERKRATKKR